MTATPDNAPPARRWLRQALTWLVGLGLLGALLRHVPLQTVREAMAAPSALVWAGTLLGLVLSYLMRAARLQVVLGLNDDAHHTAGSAPTGHTALGLRLDALRVILMHNAAVNLLPMRAGELSFPWLASTQLRMPVAHAVASLLWMRLQDLAVLLALGLLLWPGLPAMWRGAGLLLLVLGWQAGVRLLNAWHASGRDADHAGASRVKALLQRLNAALIDPHHHRPAAWLFTWANWAIKLTAGALLLSAITGAGVGAGWAGALGGELAAVVPLQGPAGFGTYEAGVWAGFALSVPGSSGLAHAVAAALALHMCFLLCAVAAGAIAWATPSWSSPRLPD